MKLIKRLAEIARTMKIPVNVSSPRAAGASSTAVRGPTPSRSGVPVSVTTGGHPELIAEAAMCIWECMLEYRPGVHPDALSTPWSSQMDRMWETYGTVEMRHYAYRLALTALDVFDLLGREWIEDHEILPYDWEFIPLVVSKADWTALYDADNRPQRIVDEIRKGSAHA